MVFGLGAVAKKAPETVEEARTRLRKLFDSIDKDKSGSLSKDEVATLAQKSGDGKLKGTFSHKKLDKAMSEMDPDGSGTVSFEEFFQWHAKQHPELAAMVPPPPPARPCKVAVASGAADMGEGTVAAVDSSAETETAEHSKWHATGAKDLAKHLDKTQEKIAMLEAELAEHDKSLKAATERAEALDQSLKEASKRNDELESKATDASTLINKVKEHEAFLEKETDSLRKKAAHEAELEKEVERLRAEVTKKATQADSAKDESTAAMTSEIAAAINALREELAVEKMKEKRMREIYEDKLSQREGLCKRVCGF
jgi:DNA repair exonuclease SbcCD ATPase subunit